MNTLATKTVIITGASSGIGRAAATLFAHEGANLILGARRAAALQELASAITREGGHAVAVPGDLTTEAANRALVEAALEHFGNLDAVFNNAGALGTGAPVTSLSLADWDHTLRTNLTSAFLAAKCQIPAMRARGGSVIFTSSFVGPCAGLPNTAAYAAAKAGLIGLTHALAAEYGADGIRVNALLPGGTRTPMADAFASSPEVLDYVTRLHALKRLAEPEEIAQAALHLASDASSFITGSAMHVDGGASVCRS